MLRNSCFNVLIKLAIFVCRLTGIVASDIDILEGKYTFLISFLITFAFAV